MRRWFAACALACGAPTEPQATVALDGRVADRIAGWEALSRPDALLVVEEDAATRRERRFLLEVEDFTAIDPTGSEHPVEPRAWPGTEREAGLVRADGAWWAPGTWTLRMESGGHVATGAFTVVEHGQTPQTELPTQDLQGDRDLFLQLWYDWPALPVHGALRFRILDPGGSAPRLLVYSEQAVRDREGWCRAATIPLDVTPEGYVTATIAEQVVDGRWPLRIDGGSMRFGLGKTEWDEHSVEGLEIDVWVDAQDLNPLVAPALAQVSPTYACDDGPGTCEICPNAPDRWCVRLSARRGTSMLIPDDPAWFATYESPCLPPRAGQYHDLWTGWMCASVGPAGLGASLTLLVVAATRRRRRAA